MDMMRRNGSTLTGGQNSESMAVLFRNYTANNLNNRSVDHHSTESNPDKNGMAFLFRHSASIAQIDNGWNLDIGELAYSPSARDLSDAKVHHMLSEELWKPYRRVQFSRYSS